MDDKFLMTGEQERAHRLTGLTTRQVEAVHDRGGDECEALSPHRVSVPISEPEYRAQLARRDAPIPLGSHAEARYNEHFERKKREIDAEFERKERALTDLYGPDHGWRDMTAKEPPPRGTLSAGERTNPKDAGSDRKIPLWLLSPVAKAHWALAQFAGLLKYGAWNWRSAGVRTSVYLSAMQRHIDAYTSGEELDPVDGTHHLGNIMACAAILLDARAAGKLNDDRPPVVGVRPTYREIEATMVKLQEQYRDKHPQHFTAKDTPLG